MTTGVLAKTMPLMASGAAGSPRASRRAMGLALAITTVSLIVTIAVVLSMLLGGSSARPGRPTAGIALGRQDDYALRHDWPGPDFLLGRERVAGHPSWS